MTNEEMKLIIHLGELLESVARTLTSLEARTAILEARVKEIYPKHLGVGPNVSDVVQVTCHVNGQHKDCPIKELFGHPDCQTIEDMINYVKKNQTCRYFLKEYVSLHFMDYVPMLQSFSGRLDAIEWSLPSDIRRDIDAALRRDETEFGGFTE